jgi:NADH-quinone oxidoreductase subunit F
LWGKPTVVNNVETVANAALALRDDWNGALHLFSISGNVRKPGVFERPLGIALGDLLRDAQPSEPPKAIFFGAAGGCVKYGAELVLTPAEVGKRGAMLGSCTLIVVGEKQSVPEACLSIARFFERESCGNCAPCREITGMVRKRLECALAARAFGRGFKELLEESRVLMRTASLCGLGQSALDPLVGAATLFPEEFK